MVYFIGGFVLGDFNGLRRFRHIVGFFFIARFFRFRRRALEHCLDRFLELLRHFQRAETVRARRIVEVP